jgi:hypothetical protein
MKLDVWMPDVQMYDNRTAILIVALMGWDNQAGIDLWSV